MADQDQRNTHSSVLFSAAVRTSRKGCTLVLFQRICCFLFIRLATISLIALSTNAVEIGSSRRRRVGGHLVEPKLRISTKCSEVGTSRHVWVPFCFI